MWNRLSVLIQYILPQHALSRFAGWLAECRWPWLKKILINHLIKKYPVDLHEALNESLDAYPTFNSFFTRRLKPELRPICKGQHDIASPVDGIVSQLGQIKEDSLFQAKGLYYDLKTLLGGLHNESEAFLNGSFATFYLAPPDYHRVHCPYKGILQKTSYIPGQLFSVNTKTTHFIPNLFTRNERVVSLFQTDLGPMIVILVGAMLIGSIHTVWPQSRSEYTSFESNPLLLRKGDDLGLFKMGSTVIILFAKNKITWTSSLKEGSRIKMGQAIGTEVSLLEGS